jgi:hypothetical protein
MTEQDKQALIKHFCSRDCGEAAEECTIMPCHEIELIQEFPTSEADSDTISRQAAIDALKQQAETMSEWSNRYAEQRKGVLTAVNIVEDLPPAQLGTNLAEVGTDCISRQQAIDICRAPHMRNADCSDFEMAIMMLPPEQPERIKGHWIKISPANIYECSECGKSVMTNDICAYDFCHGCGADMRGVTE